MPVPRSLAFLVGEGGGGMGEGEGEVTCPARTRQAQVQAQAQAQAQAGADRGQRDDRELPETSWAPLWGGGRQSRRERCR